MRAPPSASDGEAGRSSRGEPLRGDAGERAAFEYRVSRRHEEGRNRPRGQRTPDCIGGPERLRLARVAHSDPEGRALADQLLHLAGEMTCDDGGRLDARLRKVAEKRGDHRPPVDRENRLRPALGQRSQARALARGHDDRVQ